MTRMALDCDDKAHEFAVIMHQELQWQVHSFKSVNYPTKLWKTLTLLQEIFDKMASGRYQHGIAHIVLSFVNRTKDSFMEHYSL